MPFILEAEYNLDTGELISREVVGETERSPNPEVVELLYRKWLQENKDGEAQDIL